MALADYHQFAIPCAVKEAESSITFEELENELGGGYYAQVLYGSENGQKSWRMTFPTLTGGSLSSRTATGINGETLTYEAYLWDLFCEQKATGIPFAFRDTRSNQFYLVRFADKVLTYQRMLTKLYSTGIELKQWRLDGQTAFSPGQLDNVLAFDPVNFPDAFDNTWVPVGSVGSVAQYSDFPLFEWDTVADVIPATSGTLPVVRFSSTTNDGVLTSDTGGFSVDVFDVFLLMKMREATFSNGSGILTGHDASFSPPLIGASGTTKFFNVGFGSSFEYRLNGGLYAESDMQAPMNAWGIVHLRFANGTPIINPQLGKDRATAGTFAEMDLAYVIVSGALLPKSVTREIYEFLGTLKAAL